MGASRDLDYDAIEKALREMSERSRLMQIVKAEMIRRDRWKTKTRGTTFKKGHDNRRVLLKPAKRDQE